MGEANILIVGAGPVGLAAALELARRGYAPRILDKGAGFTPIGQSRALAINHRTLQLLEASGVSARLIEAGNKMTHMRVVNERGRDVIKLDFSGVDALYPFMLILPQGATERYLAAALKTYGIEVEWNAEIIAANRDVDKPRVDVNRPDGVETIRCDILIGADGAGSTIRKEFGFGFDGEGYPMEFSLADVDLEGAFDEREGVLLFQRNKGVLVCIPLGGGRWRVVAPRPDLTTALPQGLKVKNVVWRSEFRINFRHVETMQKGAVFLAGDAAHVHSPVGARGMNLGVEDACWLAWMIDQGDTDDYSRRRLPEARMVITQTKKQTNLVAGMNVFQRFMRDHLINSFVKMKSLKRGALKRITGLDTADPPWLSK